MDTDQKITYGLFGTLFMVVAAMGGDLYLTDNELDNAYICTSNQNIGFFERFSSTMKTGYWTEDDVEKSKVCRSGIWVKLKQYAQDNSIDLNVLLDPSVNPPTLPPGSIQYLCDPINCTRIL